MFERFVQVVSLSALTLCFTAMAYVSFPVGILLFLASLFFVNMSVDAQEAYWRNRVY